MINTIKNVMNTTHPLPFSVYTSVKEQYLLNVPIVKPLLIVVINGEKKLGKNSELICHSGNFIFLPSSSTINMRNIPSGKAYFALLIEFDFEDFNGLKLSVLNKQNYCIGKTTRILEQCLQQFIECSQWAPKKLWPLRRREIIELLCHMGHEEVLSMVGNPKIGHQLHDIFYEQNFKPLTIEYICEQLAMSESTLRRKLKAEGTSLQEIKDQARLSFGLHLLQTSDYSIILIADKCGYQSQSRFTARFKGRFGLTPSELRKTKM